LSYAPNPNELTPTADTSTNENISAAIRYRQALILSILSIS